ncbi:oxygenase MpaB family protein [Nocardioides sediminis]|uniref:oxygenase MpaB family protein n=1 Tax=Nocardioides sediminis TaxID=433648 RepID=UPI0019015236|nr:oxygenase MpaB family protein [Nocardioides sediminis]
MGVLTRLGLRLAHPRRYDNLRRIRALDPERDADEILGLTARREFPWDYSQGTGIAFMRDFGVPSIAELLHRTGEFEHHGLKRYDDTILIGQEATVDGIDSERGHAAVRRLNRIHGHYDIPDDEYAYVLATTLVGPVRWISAYGWRPLDPHELVAMTRVTTRFGELMGIKGLPTTYDGYLALLVDFERTRFAPSAAGHAVAEATIAVGSTVVPAPLRPLVRRVSIAIMDEPLRIALGMPEQPAWLGALVRRGLQARRLLLRLAPPRREEFRHRAATYPGGHRLSDLGPLSMLDTLNAHSHPPARSSHA